jgi:predicted nucleic acid-binding protein
MTTSVISDNSPLSALAEIGALEWLRVLYGRVLIPQTVAREGSHAHAPERLRQMLLAPPDWIKVCSDPELLPEVSGLDDGEACAISLAWAMRPQVLVIVDDFPARKLCQALGLPHTGTAGIVFLAAHRGLCDFEDTINQLRGTRFRISEAVIEGLRRQLHEG